MNNSFMYESDDTYISFACNHHFTLWGILKLKIYQLLIQIFRDMRFPTMWYMGPAKAQTSLRIRAVWSEPFLVAWIFYEYRATDRTAFGVPKLKRRLHRLVWVYSCQYTTLLEITCRGSVINKFDADKWSNPNVCDQTAPKGWSGTILFAHESSLREIW